MPDAAIETLSPSRDAAWARLAALAARPGAHEIRPLFERDPHRAARYTAHLDDLTLDVSKSSVSDEVMEALLGLLDASGFVAFRDRLFAGEVVNPTEGRSAMHMALRAPRAEAMHAALPEGIDDAASIVADELAHMRAFVGQIHGGALKGATGQTFDSVLNIGIGGSDLGPRMACEALTSVHGGVMRARFLSNVDGHAFEILKRELDPARTLVLVASKTFTTLETLTNAHAVRDWIAGALRWRNSAFPPSACSVSATGSAGATRCGRRSVCRSRSPPAGIRSRPCWTAATPSTSISGPRRHARTCRS
jgi:glucose-6-phosphate isomerase